MKVLFYCATPFALARGGFEIQIEQTRQALLQLGTEVDYVRWFDPKQKGDIIHHFGRPMPHFLQAAHQRGFKMVVTDLLGATGARSRVRLAGYKLAGSMARRFGFERYFDRMGWGGIDRNADAVLLNTPWDAKLMRDIFGVAARKVHVLLNGVSDAYLNAPARERGPWLVSTAWIGAVKRTLEVAEAAVLAGTPIWVIGRPREESDPYSERFIRFAREHPDKVRYEGFVPDERLIQAYREARGFVLLSKFETLSLAAMEAAACECPLLLTGLPWAQTTFGDKASYCPPGASVATIAGVLRRFYDAAPNLPRVPRPPSWLEIARQLNAIYQSILKGN